MYIYNFVYYLFVYVSLLYNKEKKYKITINYAKKNNLWEGPG